MLGALAATLAAAGCVSMPSGGPVRSYSVTQGVNEQSQQYVQIVPQPPGKGWLPTQIVQGFLTASASFGNHGKVAREYMTAAEQRSWTPRWSAIVFKDGPDVAHSETAVPGQKNTVTVRVTGTPQATLQATLQGGYGSYSPPPASSSGAPSSATESFSLVQEAGQWRISLAPPELLLTSDAFENDYQLRNLYFFDPGKKYLVPDPVYVPVQANESDLLNGLVDDLITPPADWLSGAVVSTLPHGTKLAGVTLDGVTAVVNLTGTAIVKAGPATLQDISDQLVSTLAGDGQGESGQSVQSVTLALDGKTWTPPGAQGNPVQPKSTKQPAAGATSTFYYVDSAGYLTRQDGAKGKPARLEQVGLGVGQVTVSANGKYVALLRGTTLYAGPINGPMTRRGAGYTALSWDASDDLLAAAGPNIVLFRGPTSAARIPVTVSVDGGSDYGVSFSQLQVAPDGVRVALVADSGTGSSATSMVNIGAISGQTGAAPQITLSQVTLAPQGGAAMFTGRTWYGAADVIALAQPGPVATAYAVSGGGSTNVAIDPGMRSITASAQNSLVAGLSDGDVAVNGSIAGAWTNLARGNAPAYQG